MVIVDHSYEPCNCIAACVGFGQQRPFTSKKDTKKHITSGPKFVFRIALII